MAPAAERTRRSGIFCMSGKSVLNGAARTLTAQVIASAEARDGAVAGLKGDNENQNHGITIALRAMETPLANSSPTPANSRRSVFAEWSKARERSATTTPTAATATCGFWLQPAGRGLGAPVIARSPLRWRISKEE